MDRVKLLIGGEVVPWSELHRAEGVMLTLAQTKTDQHGHGSTICAGEVLGDSLCLLENFRAMAQMNPGYFAEGNTHYLFTLEDGRVLSSERVSTLLKEAALRQGMPLEAFSVISIRAGAASAAYDAGCSIEDIGKRGRWKTDCWKRYVWDGTRRDPQLASRMLANSVDLSAPVIHYNRRVADRSGN